MLDMFVKSVHQVRCFPRSSLFAVEKLFFSCLESERKESGSGEKGSMLFLLILAGERVEGAFPLYPFVMTLNVR